MKTFNKGDLVWWKSEAGGHVMKKQGEVIAIVPANHLPRTVLESTEFRKERRMFDGTYRREVSYLVRVKTGKTTRGAHVIYWPRVSSLFPVHS